MRLSIAPSLFRCSVLVAELADEAVAYAHRVSLRKPDCYFTAVRELGTFLDEHLPTVGCEPAEARLAGMKIDLIEALFCWEADLRRRHGLRSAEPYRKAAAVLALIDMRAERDPNVPETLRRRAAGPPTYKRRPNAVLDEYSNEERLALQEAARADVRALEKRLTRGQHLLRSGADPRREGWHDLANLVWAAKHRLLTTTDLLEHLPMNSSSWSQPIKDVIEANPPGRERGVYACLKAINRLLFPSEQDLQPFRVLLLLGMADCTPEELLDLRMADLEFSDAGVRVRQTKLRANRIRADFHPDLPDSKASTGDVADLDGDTGSEVYLAVGRWDVGGLLRRLMEVTWQARESFDSEDVLFLAVEAGRPRTTMRARVATWTEDHNGFSAWISWHRNDDGTPAMAISQPHYARRLRKTVKTARVAALGGTLTDVAADDHHIEVFRHHYAHGTTALTLAGRSINRAQERVFHTITTKPMLLDTQAEHRLAEPEVAEAAGMTVEHAAAMRAGEYDMGLTHCRDPYDSPFTPGGKPCHVAPAMCMICRNAVVFISQLPRLLLLAAHIERMRDALDPIRWTAIWGTQATALAEVFAECTAQQLHDAHEAIGDQGLRLDLPLGMRTEYDR
ncbi:hypothetical protein DI005_18020 [Prauserella sp. PE36]|uniref:Uncharacterized protein n=3 Tax=Pseudonocardiaceae TaxID=2070 RepID=A0A2V4AF18_9PSEU|nr:MULTISPECIES: hypothetical protein [Pseudonocardiaceae]PXY18052.1 hypothetical protein BAY60_33680 [Prauserella muralis]PXY18481.1 hypothetical protein BAY59_34210 [Prauserella coralliicola]SFB63636.1 hypothetical protein SAMN05216266_13624 [Amycolatopsis marina]MBE1579622.1 hypothetical protein [Amycolatopsis roodepoortensis]RBM18606.1 hypothetical protein DI005_18020 [Prauserella sp. PE36]